MKKLFVGIDFSKEKIDVAIIFAEGLTETSMRVSNEFKNSVSGYKQLVKWVEESSNETEPSLWLFCGENTGDYSKIPATTASRCATSSTEGALTCGLRMQKASRTRLE